MEEKKLNRKKADNGKYGFVDEKGNWIIEPKFDRAEDFYKGETEVFDNGLYKILLSDGTFKKMSKMEEYVLSCKEIQNWGPGGWSFLEASNKDGKWTFDSWSRSLEDNREWYDDRWDWDPDDGELIRYYDTVGHNKEFANWANSLNLSTPEEVGELLWANAQQLLNDAKEDQESGGYSAPLSNLTCWIQLYNQLVNIKELGLLEIRNNLDLPKEPKKYLDPVEVKKIAVQLAAKEVDDEEGYEYLDVTEFLEKSRKSGEYKYISDFEGEGYNDEDDEDWEEEED